MPNARGHIILFFLSLGIAVSSTAQPRNPNYDTEKKIHLGFSALYNRADFKLVTSPAFYSMDTLWSITTAPTSGLGIGMLMDYRVFEYGNVRVLPGINFCNRNLQYTFKGGETRKLRVESTYIDLPVLFKIKSERISNWRFYMVGGGKYSYDLQSKKNRDPNPSNPSIPLTYSTVSYEFGAGLDLYFDYFKLSPEIKISNNINNALVKNPYLYTQALSGVYGRLLQISLHFEQ